jgi:hypothetical protein
MFFRITTGIVCIALLMGGEPQVGYGRPGIFSDAHIAQVRDTVLDRLADIGRQIDADRQSRGMDIIR